MPTDIEWAWIAGIVEGEAALTTTERRYPRVAVRMTDRDIIQRLQDLVPCPSGVTVIEAKENRKTSYQWILLESEYVTWFLTHLLPWLGERRTQQAHHLLSLAAKVLLNRQNHGYLTHCKHGHPYDEENTGYSESGQRRFCRACRRDINARHRAK